MKPLVLKVCAAAVVGVVALFGTAAAASPLRVVTTLPDYASIAKAIGGDRVEVWSIVKGDQDAHFIRPKPSFVSMVKKADVLVSTGLDLELWLPTVINKSGNIHVRSGTQGFVSTAAGIPLLEKPKVFSRVEGGVHIYGNPHITCSPINMRTVAKNIATGLITNDPAGKDLYQKNLKRFLDEMDKRLFGEKLVATFGADTLCELGRKGMLYSFLKTHTLQGKPLTEYLGGWYKQMLPLEGTPIVTYHKDWIYFLTMFDLQEAGNVEPKPAIPPSAKHVTELVRMMKSRHVPIVLAANYFDAQKTRAVAARGGAEAVIVPLYVGGAPGTDDYFHLVDCWVKALRKAAVAQGLIKAD